MDITKTTRIAAITAVSAAFLMTAGCFAEKDDVEDLEKELEETKEQVEELEKEIEDLQQQVDDILDGRYSYERKSRNPNIRDAVKRDDMGNFTDDVSD